MSVSSLIAATVDQFRTVVVEPEAVPVDLLAALGSVPDPRSRRGVRHRFTAILGIGVCAVLAGARSFTAIAEWAQDLTPAVRLRLGLGRRAPCESTIRRVLQHLDAETLDVVLSSWLAAQADSTDQGRVIAVDGKSARGARGSDGRAVHLLAAFDTATGTVLGQSVVDGKTNEINVFAPLLDRVEVTGAIITADAMHTQRGHVDYLTGRGAHYLLTVKGNQPTLLAQLKRLPWAEVPVADTSTSKGHGRIETRTVKITAVSTGIEFPTANLAIKLTRRRRPPTGARWRTETVYAITDLTHDQTTTPAELADAIRAHWGIENRLHWIRDVTFAEDLSQIRTGHGPAVLATLRNLAISLHRRHRATNIAAACRHLSRHPNRVLPLLL
ncbi:MAG: ISAs1 family transposase [Acidimicrobiales bacterium]